MLISVFVRADGRKTWVDESKYCDSRAERNVLKYVMENDDGERIFEE